MIEELRRVALFKTFPEEALEELSSLVVVENRKAGEVLFTEGDKGDSAYIIVSGEVAVQKRGQTLNRFQGGEVFGEKHFDKDIRSADAVAQSDAVLYRIKHVDFKGFLLKYPQHSLGVLWNIFGEATRRLFKARQHLITIFETGKIVGEHLTLSQISQKILSKLRETTEGSTGGMILVRNPFTESDEVASEENMTLLDRDGAVQLIEREGAKGQCHSLENGVVLIVPLRDGERLLGYILMEKKGQAARFSVEEEIIVSAVGDQVGLGIMNTFQRQEDEARLRLEQSRMRRY